jgi:cytoskeletal protein RodZ
MKLSERLFTFGVFVFAVGALAFLSAPMISLTPAIAQQTTTTTTTGNTTSPEESEAATTQEEHGHASNETATEETTATTVRDSAFALLTDQTIPASGFIHLYDTTP